MSETQNRAGAEGGWRLEHTYAALPAGLHTAVAPTPVRAPRAVAINRALAEELGLEAAALATEAGAALLAGNALPPGAEPLAQAYAGHQYGHFTTLGDGRAILLGEQPGPDGRRWDVQLKGAGRTPYSRRGDGRAALGPMLREYLMSEAMHALGIPTTRSLAVVATGEPVYRPEALPGAVLTRVAASHVRVGTFQWAAVQRDPEPLRALTEYTVNRHYPALADEAPERRVRSLLRAVADRQADLIAQWMATGFVHGVMNTDNMSIAGETIDYGPCAFLDVYAPARTFSSIDAHGRYAFGNQPHIAQWNLARLAETLLPLIDADEAKAVAAATEELERFGHRYRAAWLQRMRAKLGLATAEPDDGRLIGELLAGMERTGADYTNTWAELCTETKRETVADAVAGKEWRDRWEARRAREPGTPEETLARQRAATPALIPRNHRVERALAAAADGDMGEFERLLEALTRPYDHGRVTPEDRAPPPDGGTDYRTFCGT